MMITAHGRDRSALHCCLDGVPSKVFVMSPYSLERFQIEEQLDEILN